MSELDDRTPEDRVNPSELPVVPTDPADTVLAQPERTGSSLRTRIGAAAAVATVAIVGIFGAKEAFSNDDSAPTSEPIPTASAPVTPGEVTSSATPSASATAEVAPTGPVTLESLASSENIVDDALLSPELLSLKVSLAPEVLATMNEEQLTATFRQALNTADSAPMAQKVQIFALTNQARIAAGLTLAELTAIPAGDYQAFIDYRVTRDRAIMIGLGANEADYNENVSQEFAIDTEFFGRRFGITGVSLAQEGTPYQLNLSTTGLEVDEATNEVTVTVKCQETDREESLVRIIGYNDNNKPVTLESVIELSYSDISDTAKLELTREVSVQTF
jgi:hypothetical protein